MSDIPLGSLTYPQLLDAAMTLRAELDKAQRQLAEARTGVSHDSKSRKGMSDHKACPCLHTTPCDPRCTCVSPSSSFGCRRCCSYGSPEQQRVRAEYLASKQSQNERLVKALEWALARLRINTITDGFRWDEIQALLTEMQKEKGRE